MFSKIAVATVLTLSASLGLADQMGPNGDKFYDEAAHFTNACSQGPCQAPYSAMLVYSQNPRLNKLSPQQTDVLRKISFDQAQIWGDTILEGDFHTAGRTRLDSAVVYFKGNRVVGFKIRYSEKAWNTSECAFDGTKGSLKDCAQGRIAEESFVSPDFLTFFTDEDRQADFSLGAN
jgi:hypothetical protein